MGQGSPACICQPLHPRGLDSGPSMTHVTSVSASDKGAPRMLNCLVHICISLVQVCISICLLYTWCNLALLQIRFHLGGSTYIDNGRRAPNHLALKGMNFWRAIAAASCLLANELQLMAVLCSRGSPVCKHHPLLTLAKIHIFLYP